MQRITIFLVLYLACVVLNGDMAYASTSGAGLPWESPLQQIAASLQGPVATSLSVIALIGAAVSMMFFEVGKGMRWFLTAVLGFSLVSSAYGLMGLFGLTSALL